MLGTPTEENWPGISMSEELANYHFPKYPAEPLVKRAPRLDSEGIDLVSKFLLYEARKRISAKAAMHHSYFASLGTGVNNLLDGKKTFFLNLSTWSLNFCCMRPVSEFQRRQLCNMHH